MKKSCLLCKETLVPFIQKELIILCCNCCFHVASLTDSLYPTCIVFDLMNDTPNHLWPFPTPVKILPRTIWQTSILFLVNIIKSVLMPVVSILKTTLCQSDINSFLTLTFYFIYYIIHQTISVIISSLFLKLHIFCKLSLF